MKDFPLFMPNWNPIAFDRWESGAVSVSTNTYGDDEQGPVVLEIAGDVTDMSEWMSPTKARELAAKLVEAADAVEAAGKLVVKR